MDHHLTAVGLRSWDAPRDVVPGVDRQGSIRFADHFGGAELMMPNPDVSVAVDPDPTVVAGGREKLQVIMQVCCREGVRPYPELKGRCGCIGDQVSDGRQVDLVSPSDTIKGGNVTRGGVTAGC